MDHVYKSQLQSYALKQNMELPSYAAERQGPAHAPLFRCKVTGVDVAYKNLLQEIAQKDNSLLPVYATATSGPSHSPVFTSTVEFGGKVFRGEEAKTKKLAEMSAAKVAFMSLKHGQPNQTSSPSSPCERQEAANSKSVQATPSQPSKMVTPDVPSKWIEVYQDEALDAPANSVKEVNSTALPVATHPTNDASLTAPATKDVEMTAYSAMPQNPVNDGKGTSSSSSSSSCVEDGEKQLIMGSGHQSIPSGQHVVCRPWNPEMTLPQDAEMLFRDDRFIAYRLVKP
ncbi:unnamed protein product [Thlaspi arvense]|uniref:DRBM domain-containing protein n=1 Tax=Thlaspi arvense TaxID=13288 RepID=A0AAU9SBQ6_THLAR|nr:unnamed protein product [Thlaspi arvense]